MQYHFGTAQDMTLPRRRASAGVALGQGNSARCPKKCESIRHARSAHHLCTAMPCVQLDDAGRLPLGRALVPGCGRGYDVALLARPGRHVIGLEYSAAAAGVARDFVAGALPADRSGCWSVVEGDFFDPAALPAECSPFDLVYDYTFLCALRPADRRRWARRMSDLIRPGGILVTLMFPLRPEPLDLSSGPPFALSKSVYRELLSGPEDGFDEVLVEDVPPESSPSPDRHGLEALGLWTRRGTSGALCQ